jgi:hypothetical protein
MQILDDLLNISEVVMDISFFLIKALTGGLASSGRS